VEVIFLNAVKYHLQFPLDARHCFKTSSLQFNFQFGKQSKLTGGQVRQVGRMGNDNHVVVSHRLCGLWGCVGRRNAMMKEQCGAYSNFPIRSPGELHT
jgi:hypothetical protein